MAGLYQRQRNNQRTDPFIDLLFNTLLGFSFLFLISLVFINPDEDQAKVDKQAEYVITISWDKTLADDIDLWVYAPSGHTVSYLQKEAGWLHLDRDDRGEVNDKLLIDGREVVHAVNEEVVTIRNRLAGEYIVNVYFYAADSKKRPPRKIPVKLKIDRINPRFETVYVDQVELTAQDQELTAVRFTLDDEGKAGQFNKLPKQLTPYGLDHMPEQIPDDLWTK
ncbi:hypothetical protein [Leucothrix pacifica]|uniref:Uncharacterized protein n=1 Tax=Leucothrix pacifica TaxID=1247513 RepID=A0A317CLA1_9GAMM|nr:hypothetical protein [Leucothrix pacifica]PWQ99129.1 hypothetical protein DKW60_06760 [Leucothrix pacifica]